jgi:hypothetical protein
MAAEEFKRRLTPVLSADVKKRGTSPFGDVTPRGCFSPALLQNVVFTPPKEV